MNIVKPNNCVIISGIPLTRDEFIIAHDSPIHRDLVQSQGISWPMYKREIYLPFEKLCEDILSLRVNVIRSAKLSDFKSAFNNREVSVVILVSHWKDETVEFFDGMINIIDVAESIPTDFNGILDLCVCHPNGLAKIVREKRPNCLVKLTNTRVKPIIWFHFYKLVFHYLFIENISYTDALERSLTRFLNLKGEQ